MTGYVDASALLKLYVAEPDTDEAVAALDALAAWATGRHTFVEVRRNLVRLLRGRDLAFARDAFADDWRNVLVVELDERVCTRAAELAEETDVKTLDALHLGAASFALGDDMPFLTFDRRLAAVARGLGWDVRGA